MVSFLYLAAAGIDIMVAMAANTSAAAGIDTSSWVAMPANRAPVDAASRGYVTRVSHPLAAEWTLQQVAEFCGADPGLLAYAVSGTVGSGASQFWCYTQDTDIPLYSILPGMYPNFDKFPEACSSCSSCSCTIAAWDDVGFKFQAYAPPSPTFGVCTGSSAKMSQSDCAAFQAVFDKTGGTAWSNCSANRNDPCACRYAASDSAGEVGCTGGRITTMVLHGNNLTGSIPTELMLLTKLETIMMYTNNLSGSIPDLRLLTDLAHLALWGNKLTGEIPVTLGKLTALVDVSLFLNRLTGVIPSLPFGQYTNCYMQHPTAAYVTNRFACPLPVGAELCRAGPPTCGCTGKSAVLDADDCAAWFAFRSSSYSGWLQRRCGSAEASDPCSCRGIGCSKGRISTVNFVHGSMVGSFPAAVLNFTKLTFLSLGANNLSGSVPSGALGKLTGLTYLALDNNEFTGPIPEKALLQLSSLRYLDLTGTSLIGTLPGGVLAKLTNLTGFGFGTHLVGTVPASISALTALTLLSLEHNSFTGVCPELPFENYTQGCRLGGNEFLCPLPKNAAQCKPDPPTCITSPCTGNSSGLALSECKAWLELFDATNGLQWNSCSGNRLDPCACSSVNQNFGCSGGHITWLALSNLGLSGTIPPSLGNMRQLVTLALSYNLLTGSIPSSVCTLEQLRYIDLSNNKLVGLVPPLPFVQYLQQGCCLQQSGTNTNLYACPLPAGAETCTSYKSKITCTTPTPAPVPTPVPTRCTGTSAGLPSTECSAWIELFDSTDGAGWTYCSCSRLDPCACAASDGTRSVACTGGHITVLNLVNNSMVGTLPGSVGDLEQLGRLNVGSNKITGSIPDTVARLANLTFLEIQNNKITGSIPSTLTQLMKLTWLQLDSNLITGVLPALDWAQYTDFCCLQWTGNTNLYACPLPADSDKFNSPGCNITCTPVPKPVPPTPMPIPGSSVPFIVAGSCLVAIIVVAAAVAKNRQLDKRRKGPLNKPLLEDSIDSELLVLRDAAEFDIETGAPVNAASQQLCVLQWQAGEPESVRQLPYSQIEAATGGFGAANRLAGGGSCTVFQGNLFGLMEVAVKQLHSDADEWNNTQFETEMQALCTVTHDNICCLLAFSADGPSRCLVLELCTGGALDTRLACKAVGEGPKPEPLKWAERLAIAVGIASALVHLHLHRPQLLHRDLKAANVLIDGAGKAKVADFGTVREGPTKQSGDTHMQTERRVGTRVYMYVAFIPLLLIVHLCGMGSNTYLSPPTHTHPPIPPARPPAPQAA
jgi:Leucine-rich repeat (LRR) protein/serine/threonine protein kinase